MNAPPVFDQEFLPLRAKLLEIAAALDRFDRAGGWEGRGLAAKRIRAAIEVLLADGGDRAEQIQLVFSREFDDLWRDRFGMTSQ